MLHYDALVASYYQQMGAFLLGLEGHSQGVEEWVVHEGFEVDPEVGLVVDLEEVLEVDQNVVAALEGHLLGQKMKVQHVMSHRLEEQDHLPY